MAHGALSRGEVRKTLKKLRELGVKPPRVGYCVVVTPGAHVSEDYYGSRGKVELCRHPRSRYIPNDTGYQIVTSRREHGLFGARKPTIYEALEAKLGRRPTNPELKADVERIKREALVESASKGRLSFQRRRR